jgi:hypothetical protein
MYTDSGGYCAHIIGGILIGALFGAGAQIIANVLSGEEWYNDLGGAILGGAVAGALTSVGASALAVGIFTGLTTGLGNQIDDLITGEELDFVEMATDSLVSGLLAGFGSSLGNNAVGYSNKQVAAWFKPQTLGRFFSGGFGSKVSSMILIGLIPTLAWSGAGAVANIPEPEAIITDLWGLITGKS